MRSTTPLQRKIQPAKITVYFTMVNGLITREIPRPMKMRLPIRRNFQAPLPLFLSSFQTPDAVRQNKGSKQDWQKLHYDLRIRKEKHSDDQQNTAGKKIQDRSI